jgi:hypothetical protein
MDGFDDDDRGGHDTARYMCCPPMIAVRSNGCRSAPVTIVHLYPYIFRPQVACLARSALTSHRSSHIRSSKYEDLICRLGHSRSVDQPRECAIYLFLLDFIVCSLGVLFVQSHGEICCSFSGAGIRRSIGRSGPVQAKRDQV